MDFLETKVNWENSLDFSHYIYLDIQNFPAHELSELISLKIKLRNNSNDCRDIVELVGNHLTLFRQMKGSIRTFESLSSEEREECLKRALIKNNQLHPALHSQEFETKVTSVYVHHLWNWFPQRLNKWILFFLQGSTAIDEWHGCSCFTTSRCAMLCDEGLGPWTSGLCSDAACYEYCESWVISLRRKLWSMCDFLILFRNAPMSSLHS